MGYVVQNHSNHFILLIPIYQEFIETHRLDFGKDIYDFLQYYYI
jgi:hypothetical protein